MYYLIWLLMIVATCMALGNHPWLALMAMVLAFVLRCCCHD